METTSPMFLRQIAIRKMAVDMAIPEKTIELVLKHTFDGAFKAFYENRSIEISGFGKFLVDNKRVKSQRIKGAKQIEAWNRDLQSPELSEHKKENRKLFIQRVEQQLQRIKTVIHED